MPEVTSALHLLHRAGQCADELFASQIKESDLTPRQFVVLMAVAGSEEPSQTTLVQKTGIDRSTIADIVRRLVERGLSDAQAHPPRRPNLRRARDRSWGGGVEECAAGGTHHRRAVAFRDPAARSRGVPRGPRQDRQDERRDCG